MENNEDEVKKERVVEARARNISHNVRCTECGSQSIEDSQADVAILLRKFMFICGMWTLTDIRSGKSDKEIYKKLEDDFGETVLYAPKFDMQTAALWLSPIMDDVKQLLVAGAAGGIWAYKRYRQKTNVHIMALNLVRGVPLTPKEKETMLEVLTPPLWRNFFFLDEKAIVKHQSVRTCSLYKLCKLIGKPSCQRVPVISVQISPREELVEEHTFLWLYMDVANSVTHNMTHSPQKAAAIAEGKSCLTVQVLDLQLIVIH
ncbi:UNVERIFIED_CONTAM: Cytochrome c-type biogenesis CcmH-like mitochondrial protein [Sesamum radiatum]|uniref:Cytochrome c-type biogenesis protein n=1 Tax=Sesamum radiatum TaxID=300843 RepID=A0AAW2PGG9_SESRA